MQNRVSFNNPFIYRYILNKFYEKPEDKLDIKDIVRLVLEYAQEYNELINAE